jgi:hypothetical protein
MYSIKKYGGNKKSAAGISLDAIQGVFGHSEKKHLFTLLIKMK